MPVERIGPWPDAVQQPCRERDGPAASGRRWRSRSGRRRRRPGTGTWATYPHNGLYYSADRNGVYILRLTVEPGQLAPAARTASLHETMSMSMAAEPMPADPDEEAKAALERPHGEHCSLPLPEL
jgi:hypothetical protein